MPRALGHSAGCACAGSCVRRRSARTGASQEIRSSVASASLTDAHRMSARHTMKRTSTGVIMAVLYEAETLQKIRVHGSDAFGASGNEASVSRHDTCEGGALQRKPVRNVPMTDNATTYATCQPTSQSSHRRRALPRHHRKTRSTHDAPTAGVGVLPCHFRKGGCGPTPGSWWFCPRGSASLQGGASHG